MNLLKQTQFVVLRLLKNNKHGQIRSLSSYRYTLNNDLLSKKERDSYEENGFLVVRNVVDGSLLERWNQRFNDYAAGKVEPNPLMLLQRELATAKTKTLNERTLYKIGELYNDDVLFEYCEHKKVLDYVECFTGPNIMAIHTMLINKPPDSGTKSSRHPLHQDLHYFPNRPADRIVCAWTAMERITRDNGCLVAVPGSHRGEHLEHGYPDWEGGVNKLYFGIKDMSTLNDRTHVTMEAGDTIFFHPLLIHGSGMNRTSGFRKAISCHYSTADCEFIDVKGTIQEELANETLETMGKRFGDIKLDYATFWKLRARLVRGVGGYEV